MVEGNKFIPNNYFVYNYTDRFDKNFQPTINNLVNPEFSNRCCLITGPNYSGKSVFMKQVKKQALTQS